MEANRRLMRRLCTIFNSIDGTYLELGKREGIRLSELWLLYALDDDAPHSQTEICRIWGIPKSTLNSALKPLEARGLLTLAPRAGRHREREISLTPAGRDHARTVLRHIHAAEDAALAKTVSQYGEGFAEAMAAFDRHLQRAFAELEEGET